MKIFDVLDPNTDICKNYLIEASAGTGKTFSIENIIVRLLQKEVCSLDQMLIVTFTRAATRDLKERIRKNIVKAYEVNLSSKPLHQALLLFDQANIETIHGFCSRSLRELVFEGNVSMDVISDKEQLSNTVLQQVIHDFFRTRLNPKKYSPAQVRRIRLDLEMRLLSSMKKGITVAPLEDFSELFNQFKQEIEKLQCSAEKIISEFEKIYPSYKKYDDAEEKVARFAHIISKEEITPADFDQLIEDDLAFVEALDPSRKRVRAKDVSESFYYQQFKDKLSPIITKARDKDFIFGRMVRDCLEMVEQYLESEELMRFDDLLNRMHQAVKNPAFAERIKKKYKVLIVDEFQDTDPLQWDIFKTLATNWDGLLYLVGDPKQSIYGFRNADIYTYLDAADFLGEEAKASLQTNYRSSPPLVHAFNTLFSLPDFIPLPRRKECLNYPIAQVNERNENICFKDDLGAVHFFIAQHEESRKSAESLEREYFFPFIVQEIQKVKRNAAILVRKRSQGKRVAEYLKKYGIPCTMKQMEAISQSEAYQAFHELLLGILHPRDEGHLKTALGGPLIGWSDQEIVRLEEETLREQVLEVCYHLRQQFIDQGFAPFIQELLQTQWPLCNQPLSSALLGREEGFFLYEDLMHLVQLILKHEVKAPLSPEGVMAFLEEIKTLEFDEDDAIRRVSNAENEGVQILTMHASKGLEFDVVFALGLVDRTPEPDRLIPNREEKCLDVVLDEIDPRYQLYCQELDAEKMRQLYVAMTRAKYRLYIPVIEAPQVKAAKGGMASPMELYLEKLKEPLISFVEKQPKEQMSYSIISDIAISPSRGEQNVTLKAPKKIEIPGCQRYIQSFSSLATSSEESTLSPPRVFSNPEKSIHTLPAGSETGIVLHRLLEKIPIRHYENSKEVERVITPYIEGEFKEWKSVLAECVYAALHTPLGSFCLADVDSREMYREVEFLYPNETGFMKGVMDLAFYYEGKYYILDWKSNWLGSDHSSYTQENLIEVMKQHSYDLQASIYKEAFTRFMKLLDQNNFGGVYYVFLRGLHPSADTGILHRV